MRTQLAAQYEPDLNATCYAYQEQDGSITLEEDRVLSGPNRTEIRARVRETLKMQRALDKVGLNNLLRCLTTVLQAVATREAPAPADLQRLARIVAVLGGEAS